MRGLIRNVGLAAVLLAAAAPAAFAADAMISGCNEMGAGEIGIRELVADVGDTVSVEVTIHTLNDVDAFTIDVTFPTGVLSFVRAERAGLTVAPPFGFFGGSYLPASGEVRLSGWDTDPQDVIPSGVAGVIGLVWFEVTAPGTGAFSTGDYLDDIRPALGYVSCESVHGTTFVREAGWGHVKARYR